MFLPLPETEPRGVLSNDPTLCKGTPLHSSWKTNVFAFMWMSGLTGVLSKAIDDLNW